ncbi:MAG: MoaD/ThiS family protein [Planctomycetales bacterium]|nr:MoaD/ThiS family protein [Planctomycetales bacterium]MCA9228451.1 MoaD/ThiS family protein [Planctomycetales bacterium]
MSVQVEFYGIARQRAGVASCQIPLTDECTTLGAVLRELATRFPAFGQRCCEQDRLRSDYIANLGGEQFVRDSDTPICQGQTLLILSADAGG